MCSDELQVFQETGTASAKAVLDKSRVTERRGADLVFAEEIRGENFDTIGTSHKTTLIWLSPKWSRAWICIARASKIIGKSNAW